MKNFQAAAGAVAAMALLLSGCSMFHSKDDPNKKVKCSEAVVSKDVVNNPPLKVPDGMVAPNTAGSVQIPTLNEPEKPRADTDPCLTSPPDYGTPDSGTR